MRGASALQTVLQQHPDLPLGVLVVWEPVIRTDLTAPGTKRLATVSDHRAVQFWDPKLALSTELVRAALAQPDRYPRPDGIPPVTEDTVVWDVLLAFGPEAAWSEEQPPVPMLMGAPVVDAIDRLDTLLDGL